MDKSQPPRELDRLYGLDIAGDLMDAIEVRLRGS